MLRRRGLQHICSFFGSADDGMAHCHTCVRACRYSTSCNQGSSCTGQFFTDLDVCLKGERHCRPALHGRCATARALRHCTGRSALPAPHCHRRQMIALRPKRSCCEYSTLQLGRPMPDPRRGWHTRCGPPQSSRRSCSRCSSSWHSGVRARPRPFRRTPKHPRRPAELSSCRRPRSTGGQLPASGL